MGGGGRTFPRIMPRLERSPCACSKPTSRFEVIFIFNGRINGTGLRVTRRESLLLQIPVGSRPLSKLNPACASITISRGGGRGNSRNFSNLFLSTVYYYYYCCCFSKLTFTRSKGRRKKRSVYYRLSRLVCVYIFRDICPPLSLLKFRVERYTW